MVNKSLILAFTAVAVAAPFGGPSSSNTVSKIARSEKRADGESIPDGLNYFNPNDDDETDWYNWELEDPDTQGSTVQNKADPKPDTTTFALQITSSAQAQYEEYPTTSAHHNTTLREVQTTAYKAVSTTVRDEIPAYTTPVQQNQQQESYEEPKQNNEVVEPYHTVSRLQAEVEPEVYHSSTSVQADIQDYATSTIQADVQTKSYSTPTVQADVKPQSYSKPDVQPDVQPQSYSTPTVQPDVQPQSYSTPTVQADEQPESYSKPTVQADVQPEPESYSKPTVQADVQPEPESYSKPAVQSDVQPEEYSPVVQDKVQSSYSTSTVQANVQPELYHESTSLQADVQPKETYRPAPVFNDEAPPQSYRQDSPFRNALGSYNRRDVQEGYGKAEFEKQSHVPSTTAAAACAAKSPAVAAMPAISSSKPSFGEATENHMSQTSSPSLAAAKQPESSVWSAVPYSTPTVKPAEITSAASSLPLLAAATPLSDKAVPSDARILVNNLRPNNATAETAQDVKKNTASPAQSTVKVEQISATTASIATASASKAFAPLYPTTTGAANVTGGIAAATTGATSHSNNTLPEFEGAAASSSSFIAGSVIALAIAAFAL